MQLLFSQKSCAICSSFTTRHPLPFSLTARTSCYLCLRFADAFEISEVTNNIHEYFSDVF